MEGESTLIFTARFHRANLLLAQAGSLLHKAGSYRVCWPVGVKVLNPEQYSDAASGTKVAETELKQTLEGLAEHLFGKGIEVQSSRSCIYMHHMHGSSEALHLPSCCGESCFLDVILLRERDH